MTDSTADVVVIGGGVIGTAAAYFLARKSLKVHLVEQSCVGAGTSGSAGGAVALQTKALGLKLSLAQKSLKLYEEIVAQFTTDFEYRNEGSLVLAQNEVELEFLRAKSLKLQAAGVNTRLISVQEARKLVPDLGPGVIGGSYCPADASVNPLLLVRAYRNAALNLGAQFSGYTEVTEIKTDAGAVRHVVAGGNRIATRLVVIAAGPYTGAIAKLAGIRLPLLPRKGEILVTEATRPLLKGEVFSAGYLLSKNAPEIPLSEWYAGEFRLDGLQAGVAASQTRRGNLLIGSTREYDGFDTRSTRRGLRELVRGMAAVLPAVLDLNIIRCYAGLRPSTPDGVPIVSTSPEVEGLIIATGHEGDGIALSPITGQMVAELACGEIETEELAALALARFNA